jgi:hypothetical protein
MHFMWYWFCCVPVFGVPLNYESKTEDFLFFVFQSVSRANTDNMNAPPLCKLQQFVIFTDLFPWPRMSNLILLILSILLWYYEKIGQNEVRASRNPPCQKKQVKTKLCHWSTRGIFVTERRSGSSFSEGRKPERCSGTFFFFLPSI